MTRAFKTVYGNFAIHTTNAMYFASISFPTPSHILLRCNKKKLN